MSFFRRVRNGLIHLTLGRDFLPTPPPAPSLPSPNRPHYRRTTLVYKILDQAWVEDQPPSYSQLIEAVRLKTGYGCSRKLISRWKLDRGLR